MGQPQTSNLRRLWERWKNVALTSGADIGLAGLGLVSGILTARLLAPAGKGELTAALLWPGLFQTFANFGMRHAVVYFSGRRSDQIGALAAGITALSLVMGGIAGLIGVLVIPSIIDDYSPSTLLATQVLFAWLPFAILGGNALAILQGQGRFQPWNILRVFRQVFYVGSIVALWVVDLVHVHYVVYAYLIADILVTTGAVSVVARSIERFEFDVGLLKELLWYGSRNFLASMAGQANYQLDQAIISALLAPRLLGLYKVAVSSSQFVKLMSMGFQRVIISDVARSNSDAEGHEKIRRSLKTASPFLILSSVLIALAMPLLLPLMFGQEYAPAVPAAQIMCLASAVFGMKQILYNGARGQGRPQIPLYCEFMALAVTAAGLYVLLPMLEIKGAAITSLLAYSSGLAAAFYFLRRSERAIDAAK
ncbi:hypothetical protein FIV42_13260 [Persicimonas caeni]|uniref:Oligosaccharide flippase family protein n=1 Tax=Persicimonas caeni TaxID=2292766 RepID=A0A4Y6PTW8_PERCE|nr:oligosaccharide flippase family protein [Persicimonas caeni]QDG51683.1 hypothetical protein FIV42_13260 [Persicimonas caeni]QED32904.1 oligosaccharide flippase family protein [Persicimonas caeni]